ncbi:hypothetical protein M0813_28749 [Anaeramoeba flamelloides]|uniref:Uncharacterized protein n=1 Tax=Anaeramoeba flamelloides TaxID=1746091 RepID=A0ABQ8XTK1_9EUKA|nr:hypothetical protein M0813_28749 [Anaeramoeba flamelloides]
MSTNKTSSNRTVKEEKKGIIFQRKDPFQIFLIVAKYNNQSFKKTYKLQLKRTKKEGRMEGSDGKVEKKIELKRISKVLNS